MKPDFDLITIGGGSGGVAASRRAASHGARVALIEGDRLGGTCVMRGCVPKKLLMYAGQFADAFKMARAYGWSADGGHFDMNRWQQAKADELDRLESVYRNMLVNSGVELLHGYARILSSNSVQVGDRTMTAKRILIATGGRPATVAISGMERTSTSDDMLALTSVPKRLAVIGAGYIAMEFASMFARLGSEVRVYFRANLPLKGFDEDIRGRLADALARAGVSLCPGNLPVSIERAGSGYVLRFGDGTTEEFDTVLNAAGRVPNTANLGLEHVGIALNADGAIPVNDYSETSVPGVYAIGDVTNRINLTPVAIADGRAFADTVYGGLDVRINHGQVPTAVFTDPPVGTVGLSESDAQSRGNVHVYASEFRPMRSAFAKLEDRTYLKLLVDADSDQVLGIHMIGPDAPEIIQSLAVAMRAHATKAHFDQTVAVHPTTAEEFVLMREPVRRLPRRSQ